MTQPTEQLIADTIRAFPFDDFGMDGVSYALDADPEAQEWVPALAGKIAAALDDGAGA